jgi:hypothetical protein
MPAAISHVSGGIERRVRRSDKLGLSLTGVM